MCVLLYLWPSLSAGVLGKSYRDSVDKESCQDSPNTLTPDTMGAGPVLPSSLPSSDTGPGSVTGSGIPGVQSRRRPGGEQSGSALNHGDSDVGGVQWLAPAL